METCPDYTRLLVAISHEEPDRVPLVEMSIDRALQEAWLGKPVRDLATEVEFWHKAGYDYISLRPAFEFASVTTSPIANLDDLERYPWPNPQDVDLSLLEQAAELLPLGMGIMAGVDGILAQTVRLLGFERLISALHDTPELVERTLQRVAQIQGDVLRRVIQMERVFAVWYAEDLAQTQSLLLAPEFYREQLFPQMEELVTIAHSVVLPFILHSSGNVRELIPDLIAMGVNALHPIEPQAMDIKQIKARHGKKLALFGSIDLRATLLHGAPADVRNEVRQRIKDVAPGGGYALGSTGLLTRDVSVENFDAMREATFFHGRYPILI